MNFVNILPKTVQLFWFLPFRQPSPILFLMNRKFRWSISIGIAIACIIFISAQSIQSLPITSSLNAQSPAEVEIIPKADFGRHFKEMGIEGSILIYDLNRDRVYQHNHQRNIAAFSPASTFKILNSLISLETGVISDEIAILTWDGIQRELPQWNRDLNMREAMKFSAVWFYQVLARRVGYKRMQEWVSRVEYGNQKIGTQEDIDKFWLEGEMRITPQQQVKCLQRLYQDDLPFSQRSLSIVKDILIVEQTPDYTIRAKTGWFGFGSDLNPQIGWYVGYLEKENNVYFFATNIDIYDKKEGAVRVELTRRCFKDLGLL